MKFKVSSKQLLQQLQAVGKVINTKNTLQILDNFLFDLNGEELRITGSDTETVATAILVVSDSEGSGKIAISARRTIDSLKLIPDQGIEIEINDDTKEVTIKYNNDGVFMIPGVDGDDFPTSEIDLEHSQTIEVPALEIIKGLEATMFAVSQSTLVPVMMGINWDLHQDDITFVSSDTHKLVRYINRRINPGLDRSFILPAKPAGVLRSSLTKEDLVVKITMTDKNVVFDLGDFMMQCRLINGRYPDYNKVIPKGSPFHLKADRALLLSACRRASLYMNPGTGLVKWDIKSDGAVTISAQDLDFKQSMVEHLQCEYDGTEMVIGFKGALLIDVLNNMKCDLIDIMIASPSSAGIFQPENQREGGEEEILMLVMPMQV